MTIAVVNFPTPVDAGSASSVTTSPTFTSTTGNLLIGGGVATGTTGLAVASPSFTDTGSTNTFSTGNSDAFSLTSFYVVDIEWAKNITGQASEAATFHINQTQFPSAGVIEASGCDTSNPNDIAPSWKTQAGGTLTTLTSTLITPAAGDHLIVVVGVSDGTATNQSVTNAGTGTATWTAKADNTATNEPILMAYTIITADGSHTYGVSYNSGDSTKPNMAVGIASFKAAAGGGATPIEPPMRTLRGAGL